MANKGKFFDRSPKVRPAGTIVEPDCNVGDSLKIFNKEEAAANIMEKKCMEEIQGQKEINNAPVTPVLPDEHLKELLTPQSKKTRFIAFREKFAEDMFFKKPEVGKVFPLNSKPERFTNESSVYGRPNVQSESLYELVLPNRSAAVINREYTNWHDKYVISHKHYFPSESVRRSYNNNFNPNATFGMSTVCDKTGGKVRQILQSCQRLVVIPDSQKKFKERTEGQLGKCIHRSTLHFEEDRPFGKICYPDECNVRALIENIKPCKRSNELLASIAHVNKLRRVLFNRPDFHMHDLKTSLQLHDKDSTGYLTVKDIMTVLRFLIIRANEDLLRQAMSYYDIIENNGKPNERVNLDLFWKMLHIHHTLPRKGNLATVPENFLNKDTTYRRMCQDRNAGLKSVKPLPLKYKQPSDADRTRAGDVISPDIPMHYGLGPSDFEMLRSKDVLRRIFKGVLGEKFDEVWELARQQMKGEDNCKMSIEYLRDVMTRK